MFKAIIHNAEYGPVDLDTLQRWARERRIQPETYIVNIDSGERLPSYRMPALQSIFSTHVEPPPPRPVAEETPPSPEMEDVAGESVRRWTLPQDWNGAVWASVVALAILLLVGLGLAIRYQDQVAREQQSAENLQRLNTAIESYSRDNNGMFPPMENTAQARQALLPYLPPKSDYVFISPVTNEPYRPNPALSRRRRDELDIRNLSAIATFFENQRMRDRQRVMAAFADGTVRRVTQAEWTNLSSGVFLPPSTQATPGGRWMKVLQQTGNRSVTTQPFVIVGSRWRVKYDVGGDAPDRRFKIVAHKSPSQFETLVDLGKETNRSSFAEQPGDFYLVVDTDQNFAITVEQFFPDGAPAPVAAPPAPAPVNPTP